MVVGKFVQSFPKEEVNLINFSLLFTYFFYFFRNVASSLDDIWAPLLACWMYAFICILAHFLIFLSRDWYHGKFGQWYVYYISILLYISNLRIDLTSFLKYGSFHYSKVCYQGIGTGKEYTNQYDLSEDYHIYAVVCFSFQSICLVIILV